MAPSYYSRKLAGRRLQRCYELASPRVRRYLEAEIRFVESRLLGDDVVLELGCGYGRVAFRLAGAARWVVGIDSAAESIALARESCDPGSRCDFVEMDARALGFRDGIFDVVVCVQNGVSAFHVDPAALLRESLRVTRPGGRLLFSTYADPFWPHRLAWFEAQAAEGLVGPLDRAACRDGVIVCEDGFRSGRMTADGFRALGASCGLRSEITEVDGSSLFCQWIRPAGAE